MRYRSHCPCIRCRVRGIMGPVVLITIGVLFLIGQYSGRYTFMELWPVLLIVIGAVKILQAVAPTAGHLQTPNLPGPTTESGQPGPGAQNG